ncbi:Arginine N-methyltransferase 2 [Arachnomyces sp. PD_36]|nr:Arginine N-methyltransferase 2 [Arachnomyces sp. PD_36]
MADQLAGIDVNVDIGVQEILLAASQHDVSQLRKLLRSNDKVQDPVNARDPETAFTPLHAAIAACEPDADDQEKSTAETATSNGVEESRAQTLDAAKETVRLLLEEGAIWNDLDVKQETPGCLARRLGLTELYELMVDAGVRSEMLLNRLDDYEPLADDGDEDDETEEQAEATDDQVEKEKTPIPSQVEVNEEPNSTSEGPEVSSERYLQSNLTFQSGRLLDQDQNGVMMAWESDIMARSAKNLLPAPGLRVLNIGHGMGIVDNFFQAQSPSSHHIVEAHPDVLADMKSKGWYEKPGVVVHEARWQDALSKLVEEGVTFDAIYYDTFAESYSDFREFFSEHVIGLLDPDGKWGFFNGMGADRPISYDVYQKVVEIDLFEAGFDVEWEKVKVPELEGEWAGVRRSYWAIDNYRLPTCKYM